MLICLVYGRGDIAWTWTGLARLTKCFATWSDRPETVIWNFDECHLLLTSIPLQDIVMCMCTLFEAGKLAHSISRVGRGWQDHTTAITVLEPRTMAEFYPGGPDDSARSTLVIIHVLYA